MSSVTVFRVDEEGLREEFGEAHNALACAPLIWNAVGEKLGLSCGEGGAIDKYSTLFLTVSQQEELWSAWKDPRLTIAEAACMLFTFDQSFVFAHNLELMALCLRCFYREHVAGTGAVDAMLTVAWFLDRMPKDKTMLACFQQTSVSENPWLLWDEVKEEDREFDFKGLDRHGEVFQRLTDLSKNGEWGVDDRE